jgi:hypothetical protein
MNRGVAMAMAIVLTTAWLTTPAALSGAAASGQGQATPQDQAVSRVRLVVSVSQPMNLTIDAKKELQAAVKRMTAAIGFVREPDGSAEKSKPKPASARARRTAPAAPAPTIVPAPAEGTASSERATAPAPPLPGAPIGASRAAGTVSSELFDLLVADSDIPSELASERVRDQLLAIKVSEFGVTLESVAGRPVARPVSLDIGSKPTTARAIEALELDIRESMAKWGIVLFGTHANPGPNDTQLSLFVDANECATLPARLRRGFASRITKATCAM